MEKKTSVDSNNNLSYLNETYNHKLNSNKNNALVHKNSIKPNSKARFSQAKYPSLANQSNFENKKRAHKFSRTSRYLVYFLFSLINIIVNMDSGNIPPAADLISKDFDVNDAQLGLFASFVSTGTFVGGIISLSIINIFSRKITLIICNLIIAILLYIFPVFSNIVVLYLNRVLVGIVMVCF